MKSGSTIDYKHGRKNQWRQWAWKEISKRVADKKNAKVLYLSGAQDLDRKVAVSYGFNPSNMIAVDNDQDIVKKLRDKGVIAIHGDFIETATEGIEYFDVLYADFCCGINKNILVYCGIMAAYCLKNRTVLLNMQRGRDKYINEIRKTCSGLCKEKDRAKIAYMYYAKMVVDFFYIQKYGALDDRYVRMFVDFELGDDFVKAISDCIYQYCKPIYRTYMGNKVYMDSVVFNTMVNESNIPALHDIDSKKQKQKLAAARAVSTMRKTGKLESCPRW